MAGVRKLKLADHLKAAERLVKKARKRGDKDLTLRTAMNVIKKGHNDMVRRAEKKNK